ncbi:MAG TPA: ELWxxDGT repeat protein, partial [Chryseosolibacter sp.]|nr:ELWxxDGT repeat protein [Chryseosolibacter sp.]
MIKKLLSHDHSVTIRKWRTALRCHLVACFCLLIAGPANAQTTLFADINKTGSSGLVGPVQELVYANGLVFFINNNNVWRSDGTTTGTFPLIDGEASSISQLTSCGDRVYFVATSSAYGEELWISTGDYASAININQTAWGASSSPTHLTNINGVLYFNATDGIYGREPWKAFGGYEDVSRVADILKGSGGSNPFEFEEMNGTVYFTANDGTNGYELWKTNGTATGTSLVKDVRPGTKLSSTPKVLTNVNGTLYFSAYDETNGR